MDLTSNNSPYPHVVIADYFSSALSEQCLTYLDLCAWKCINRDFFHFDVLASQKAWKFVFDLITTHEICRDAKVKFEDLFLCRLAVPKVIEIHRYRTKSGIGPHTDALINEVRCVLNLNHSWDVEGGGIWVLASDSALRLGQLFLPPLSNTGFAFATQASSFHALTRRSSGMSYGLTIRFPVVT